ncbi:MAG: ferredoxin [Anaerolineaceae bacterium]|nr:ferredoxin [Anaerolineaceae bacterium]
MKIVITSDCVTCGLCADIAPEIFRMDEELDIAVVIREPETDQETMQVQESADSCPSEAIHLTE